MADDASVHSSEGSLPPVNLGDDHSYATTNSEAENEDHNTEADMADDGSDGRSLLQFIISASKQDVEMIGFLQRTGDYPDLSEPGSCGNTPAYLAILHDRPEVLRLLNEFDVDLAEPCDAVKFATPSYYCAYLGRTECLRMLAKCDVELETSSCNKFQETVHRYIKKFNHPAVAEEMLDILIYKKHNAAARIQGMKRMVDALARVENIKTTQEEEEAADAKKVEDDEAEAEAKKQKDEEEAAEADRVYREKAAAIIAARSEAAKKETEDAIATGKIDIGEVNRATEEGKSLASGEASSEGKEGEAKSGESEKDDKEGDDKSVTSTLSNASSNATAAADKAKEGVKNLRRKSLAQLGSVGSVFGSSKKKLKGDEEEGKNEGSIVEEGEAADEKKQGGGAADNKPEVATGEETKEAAASKASSDEAKPT